MKIVKDIQKKKSKAKKAVVMAKGCVFEDF